MSSDTDEVDLAANGQVVEIFEGALAIKPKNSGTTADDDSAHRELMELVEAELANVLGG